PAEPVTTPVSTTPAASRTLAVTLGDPRGIGPEVAESAARRLRESQPNDRPRLVFVGPEGTGAGASADAFQPIGVWRAGDDAACSGRLAALAVEEATRLALGGQVDAVVTAPLEKSALHAAGYPWPGHTEMLAELARVPEVAMMMCAESTPAGGALRVVLATIHVALRDVPRLFTVERLVSQTRMADRALREQWGIAAPRIGLCAFNPHASDSGLFGDEESRIYVPALAALLADGIDARGPFPADTVFLRALRGELDAVIAPYHDVGMAAFKTAAFGRGVNVTLGLPFVRTSPDHGTALDIAGRGVADPSSMVEAITLADTLVRRALETAR
ncbi:MAG: 4-hydroxythreonine-4-phosphate dehydrogenase PdxA, partial [Longimicrobiales bacterium]